MTVSEYRIHGVPEIVSRSVIDKVIVFRYPAVMIIGAK